MRIWRNGRANTAILTAYAQTHLLVAHSKEGMGVSNQGFPIPSASEVPIALGFDIVFPVLGPPLPFPDLNTLWNPFSWKFLVDHLLTMASFFANCNDLGPDHFYASCFPSSNLLSNPFSTPNRPSFWVL